MLRWKRPALFLIILLLLWTLLSCQSVQFADVDQWWDAGHYDIAYETLLLERDKLYSEKDELLFHLDSGMLSHFAGSYEVSNQHLERAEKLIVEHFTRSISAEVSTFLTNDTARPYRGEDYEDIYLNLFMALNHYHLGSLESMMVELRRADLKLSSLQRKYQEPLERAAQLSQDRGKVQKLSTFTNSALLRYLSFLGYRELGQEDDMRIDLEQLTWAFERYNEIYHFPLPLAITEIQQSNVQAGRGRLELLAFSGRTPKKVQITERVLLDRSHYLKIALPAMQAQPQVVYRVQARLPNGSVVQLEQVEDMAAVALETFRYNYQLIEAKTIARALAKSIAAIASDQLAENAEDSKKGLFYTLSLFFQLFQEFSEQADVRLSRYFPGEAWIASVDLPAGDVPILLEFLNRQNQVIYQQEHHVVIKEQGPLQLVESFCPY